MHADPAGVLAGSHFIDGDHACCEGALAAGARFSAGYPITPSTEVVERFASRIPTVGGTFIQMEDELAASIAIQGAVSTVAFTVTIPPVTVAISPIPQVVFPRSSPVRLWQAFPLTLTRWVERKPCVSTCSSSSEYQAQKA